MDRFSEAGVEVEVCNADGEWRSAMTSNSDAQLQQQRCSSLKVVYPSGEEELVSMGRLIIPSYAEAASSSSNDLTCNRGKSAKELFDRYDEEVKGRAVARGSDYCKPSLQMMC